MVDFSRPPVPPESVVPQAETTRGVIEHIAVTPVASGDRLRVSMDFNPADAPLAEMRLVLVGP